MIDFIKLSIKGIDAIDLLDSGKLDFKGQYSANSGEWFDKTYIAQLHDCKIILNLSGDGTHYHTDFEGSIHKLWNSINNVTAPNALLKKGKGFNGNVITLSDIIKGRTYLERLFGCGSEQMHLHNLEVGFNLTVNFDPTLYIKGLLFFRKTQFAILHDGHFAQAEFQRYRFKIYDKGNQYGMGKHILRIELKFNKMNELRKLGLMTLADIDAGMLIKLKSVLIKRFKSILHYDYTMRENELSKTDIIMVLKYSNPAYWRSIDSNRLDKPKKALLRLIEKHTDRLSNQIIMAIEEACMKITQSETAQESVRSNHSIIRLQITKERSIKSCLLTGIDISMQKPDSLLLSHTGLRFYLANNPSLYSRVRNKYLTSKWHDKPLNIQITEIAHNIRDTYRHTLERQGRNYPIEQGKLFELPKPVIKFS